MHKYDILSVFGIKNECKEMHKYHVCIMIEISYKNVYFEKSEKFILFRSNNLQLP